MAELKQEAKIEDSVIFEKKKPFRPTIAEIIDKAKKQVSLEKDEVVSFDSLVSEEERVEMAIGLEQLEKPEQKTALLNMMDPRNDSQYFNEKYTKWARDNSNTHTHLASFGSKVSFWLGSTFIANPASKGVPDYVWYLPKDRTTVFSGHLGAGAVMKNDAFILATNRYILKQNERISMRCAYLFLIFGLLFGGTSWATNKIGKGYDFVVQNISFTKDKEKAKELAKEEKLAELKAKAEKLVLEAKAGTISREEFDKQAAVLFEQEDKIRKETK